MRYKHNVFATITATLLHCITATLHLLSLTRTASLQLTTLKFLKFINTPIHFLLRIPLGFLSYSFSSIIYMKYKYNLLRKYLFKKILKQN